MNLTTQVDDLSLISSGTLLAEVGSGKPRRFATLRFLSPRNSQSFVAESFESTEVDELKVRGRRRGSGAIRPTVFP